MRIGINGFGRIGRSLFRVLHEREGMEVVAVNDIADINSLAHLLKYDSVLGQLGGVDIQYTDDTFVINNLSLIHI